MDDLQLPRSPRSLHSPKFHRSGSAFGDNTCNSLTTGRDLRDDLKLTDGAGVAMTMLARTATSSSAGMTHSSIMPEASPRAAAAAKDLILTTFLAMNPDSARRTPAKEETVRGEKDNGDTGRCSPRVPVTGHGGGGGLLQELNGVTQISPSGRTAHLGERLGPGAC